MSDFTENIEIHDCPICGGAGLIEAEPQGYYVACLDCGSYTGTVSFKTEEGRQEAAERAAWVRRNRRVLGNRGTYRNVGRRTVPTEGTGGGDSQSAGIHEADQQHPG